MEHFEYIVIGNSAAGVGGCEGIRRSDRVGSIAIISDESMSTYSRCLITHYISGHVDKQKLLFRPNEFYARVGAIPLLGKTVRRIDCLGKKIELNDRSVLNYNKLLLATGAMAIHYDIPGKDKEGVHVLRTFEDAKKVSDEAKAGLKALILGGGLVGMKMADALHARGLEVIMIISSSQLLSQTMDRAGAEMICRVVERNDIKVMTNCLVTEIMGEGKATGVRLKEGQEIAGDIIIMAKGVRPNVVLAKEAGLAVDYGILVNQHMQTSDPYIYAAGDAAEAKDLLTDGKVIHAIWPNAMEQGHVAGINMAGRDIEYPGGMGMNSAEFFGLAAISMGLCNPKDENGLEILTTRDESKETYRKLVLRNNIIIGAVCIGNISCAGVLNGLIKGRINISKIKSLLLNDDFDYGKVLGAGLVDKWGLFFPRGPRFYLAQDVSDAHVEGAWH